MIDINELRIGNYLKYTDTKEIGFVVSINYDDESMKDNFVGLDIRETFEGNNSLIEGRISYFDPIPLTPELLEKCGFKYTSNHVYEYKDDENILFDEPTDWNNTKNYPIGIAGISTTIFGMYVTNGEVIIRCLYLHQLQNMYYSITGEELEAKL